jgi:hypothetical protein
VEGGVAYLAAGQLGWIHDAEHDPGVGSVALRTVPVALEPVGTAFVAEARPFVGAVRVTAGRVRVVHTDGTVLAELGPGQEAVAVTDLDSPIDVRLIHTTDLRLDALGAQLPSDCPCHLRDVVATVASLRLSTVEIP